MSTINAMTYSRVSQINAMMNRFIREAAVVKSQMNTSLIQQPIMSQMGIGNNVNIMA